ncbi:Uu.00g094710.m01.CDS01 [Anthostomella pinea]|uniref:Uu.00g094710.m01.CDS01 n=1 Tax=Anthostomella pinea TaxID=933095 RepID=A0AAI8VNQ7_9PEZI|nr:Uu.00g094710.m01.CDS01 [Anthostomella pinea]
MSTLPPDPYKILEVSKDAQLPEIRSAHRKLVLKCHPDKVQDPKLKAEKQNEFQRVQQAYELLSNETERSRYDDRVKLQELRDSMSKLNTHARSPSATRRQEPVYYDVKHASPRPSTYAKAGPYGRTPPRSYEDDISSSARFDETARYARKTASYERYDKYKEEKSSSRREDERRRRDKEKEKEWTREAAKEKERERERAERDARKIEKQQAKLREERDRMERERRREEKEEKKKAEKERERIRERDRKIAAEDKKSRHKEAYVEVSPDEHEDDYPAGPKSDKKSSSSRKLEEPDSSPATEKTSEKIEFAMRYLSRSNGGKPPVLGRSQTYHEQSFARHIQPSAPTPPPATAAPYPPPPPPADLPDITVEEDMARRSSARPSGRRTSYDTPRLPKEKSYKKATSREPEPIVVDAGSPGTRAMPAFHKSHTMPSERGPPPPLGRSQTESRSSRPVGPGITRAETFHPGAESGRGRNRMGPTYSDEDSEDDRERHYRRSRGTVAPETMGIPRTTRYAIKREPDETTRIYKKSGYAMPKISTRTDRASYYTHDQYEDESPQYFGSVNYAQQVDPHEVKWSSVPHSAHRGEVYT